MSLFPTGRIIPRCGLVHADSGSNTRQLVLLVTITPCIMGTKTIVWVRLLADRLRAEGPAAHQRGADREGFASGHRRPGAAEDPGVLDCCLSHDPARDRSPGWDLHLGLALS